MNKNRIRGLNAHLSNKYPRNSQATALNKTEIPALEELTFQSKREDGQDNV